MKKLITIITLLFSSCTLPIAKYNLNDQVCIYGIKVNITQVNVYSGTGSGFGGTNYRGRYLDNLGQIHTLHFYEKEIKPCK